MEEQQTAVNEQYVPNLAIMLNLNELNFIIEKLAKNPYEEVEELNAFLRSRLTYPRSRS